MKKKVIAASSRPLILLGVRAVVAKHPDFEVVGECDHSKQLLALIRSLEADLLIVELEEDCYLTAELVAHCRKIRPHLPILLLESSLGRLDRETMARIQPEGYLARNSNLSDFSEACLALCAGRRWSNSQPGQPVKIAPHLRGLTPRERTIVAEVSAGKTNSQIAERLILSTSTVECCMSKILRKLQINNRTHLIRLVHLGETVHSPRGSQWQWGTSAGGS